MKHAQHAEIINDLARHAADKAREAIHLVNELADGPVQMAFVNLEVFYRLSPMPGATLLYLAAKVAGRKLGNVDEADEELLRDAGKLAQLMLYRRIDEGTNSWASAITWATEKFREIEGRREKFDGMDQLIKRGR